MLFHASLVKGHACRALCLAIPLLLATTPMAVSAQRYVITDSDSPYRTATGFEALFSNTTGYENTAFGSQALFSNTTGNTNTATGVGALFYNTTGFSNTASGNAALLFNKEGNSNTAYGFETMVNNTGSSNIALGSLAGSSLTTGSNNIDIGNLGVAGESRTIRIGTTRTHTKAYMAGIFGVNASAGVPVYINAKGQLGIVTSSKRFKKDIHSLGSVSDKLLDLRPVSFRYKEAAEDGTYPIQYGLIAEEVAKIYPDLVQYDKDGKPFTVYYHLLTPLLLSEVQHQQHKLAAQEAINNTQQQALIVQKTEMTALRTQNQTLLKEVTSIKTQQQTVLKVMMERMNQLEQTVQASHNGSPTTQTVPATYHRSL